MDRRAFLSILAGSPLVFGLRELLAQDASVDFVESALKRMKETRRFGVMLVIPADPDGRKRLGQNLISRLPTALKSRGDGCELFIEVVFVCVDAERAKDFGAGRVEGDGVVRLLLNPQGKRVEEDRVPWETLEDSKQFVDSFMTFVNGAEGERLRDHARTIEKDLPENLKKAANEMKGSPREIHAAATKLKAAADTIAPWLVQKAFDDGAVYVNLLRQLYQEYSSQEADPTLPFGVRVERVRNEDPCPPCGMSAFPATSYRFLSFYAK